MSDWLHSFIEYTDGSTSPDAFRLWAAIATVAGALERRVWVETQRGQVFPNLYTLLIAPPGIGKSVAIKNVTDLWLSVRELRVAPDSVTKAALVDAVKDSSKRAILSPTSILSYASLLVASSEFGVLVPAHDLEFLNSLNHIYDNPGFYRERRRHAKEPLEIIKPQLNIIAGTQPAYLANILPEEAWGMGFMSRIIMVYSREKIYAPMFGEARDDEKLFSNLAFDLNIISKLHGKFEWTKGAMAMLEDWVKKGAPPAPEHGKLESYSMRRPLHVLKLCMVSSAMRSNDLQITEDDLKRAFVWLFGAEEHMTDVFKDMVYKSDAQVIAELHYFAWRIWVKEKKPIHKSRLVHFLHTKVPAERIQRVLDIADQSKIIVNLAGTETYEPKARTDQPDAH